LPAVRPWRKKLFTPASTWERKTSPWYSMNPGEKPISQMNKFKIWKKPGLKLFSTPPSPGSQAWKTAWNPLNTQIPAPARAL
jgi:hypothetical protein